MKINSSIKKFFIVFLFILCVYGIGRLYFAVTAGFTVGNISSQFEFDPRWETHELSASERENISQALDQEYDYLGKGCQSYVFASRDGKYVIKFFKFQRFRPQVWLQPFTFIPAVKNHQATKAIARKLKLDKVFRSWKLAYEHLQKETGVLYVHLNKSDDWHKKLTIHDKLGLTHQLDIDQMEFMIQHRADMLCGTINALMANREIEEAEKIIDRLLSMMLSEYFRGYADNDHALMQNTGVLDGQPIHIDAGQFIYNEKVKSPAVYKKEIFNKTYKFNLWLKKHHSDLSTHLEGKLLALLGPDYYYQEPYRHVGDVGKIPHVEGRKLKAEG